MRRALAASAIVSVLLAVPVFADKAKELDVSEMRDSLIVLHDGAGHYFALQSNDTANGKVFYGTGKKFHLQRTTSRSGYGKAKKWSRGIWSPSSPDMATLKQDQDTWFVTCGAKNKTPLTRIGEDERVKLLKKAKFYPRLWHRAIQVFARDEDANYYLVDTTPKPRGSKTPFVYTDVRAYRGPAGRMKRLKLKEFASDAEGMVLLTKVGKMLVDRDKRGNLTVHWKPKKAKKGEPRKSQLRVLSSNANRHLIFTTLGVYPLRLGTPCDDLYTE